MIDDQMESLIQKELIIIKQREESQKESENKSTQTVAEKQEEVLLKEIASLNHEILRLKRDLKSRKLADSDPKSKTETIDPYREKYEKLKRENESLMEIINKQAYQSQKMISVF